MTLVSSANIMGSGKVFIVGEGHLYIIIMKSKGPRIYPWRNPCYIVSQYENKLWVLLGDFISTSVFYLLDRK
jgi:hypothetical protein